MRGLMMGVVVAAAAGVSSADTIAYWNFNDSANRLGVSTGSGTLTTNFVAANVQYFGGSTSNAQGGDIAGQALSLQNGTGGANNGRNATFQISTSNFENLVMTFVTQRTDTGFNSNQIAYSTDGATFTNFGSAYTPASTFALQTFDFSSISALDNAASVFVRITFNGGTTNSSAGNNRIDNVVFTADPIVIPLPPAAFAGIAGLGLAGIASRIRRR